MPDKFKAGFWLLAFFLLLNGATLLASCPLAGAARPANTATPLPNQKYKILHFPTALVAQLEVYQPALDAKGMPTTIRRHVAARGDVKLPDPCQLNIQLEYAGLEFLQTLAQINPTQVIQFKADKLDLEDAQFAFFKRFFMIYRLNLDSTLITDKSIPIIASFRRLVDLRLSKTEITGAGFELFDGLPLTALNLEGSNMQSGSLQKFKSLPKQLITLNVSKTSISDKDIVFVGKCQGLCSLDLSGNKKITDACVQDICKLKQLDYLNLIDTGITEKSLPAIAKLPHLVRLCVRYRTFWKLGQGKSPRPSLQIVDGAVSSRTPADVFTPLH